MPLLFRLDEPSLITPDSKSTENHSYRVGVACAILAHVIWGVFPLYWRLLGSVSAIGLTAHRVVWSFALLAVLSLIIKRLRQNVWVKHDRPTLTIHAVAALMIAINWLAFLYAVGTNRVLQASLGYYINPLVNVLLGVLVLHERLRFPQMVAVALATIGVGVMAFAGNGVPWIALAMAISFGFYGLMKKQATLGPLEGLTLETGILFPLAISYLVISSQKATIDYPATIWILLVVGGALTISPLALFAIAAKRISLSTIGILQYVGPTLQWIVGAIVLKEPISRSQLIGFAFVWSGVLVFLAGDRIIHQFRRRPKDSLS